MADLIDRQTAINALAELPYGIRGMVKGIIAGVPSAQPEVIRCKDCKNWDTSWQNDYAPNYHYCPLVDGTRRDDFYCADAERRSDG